MISSFISSIRQKVKRVPNVLETLEQLLGAERFSVLAQSTPDRRELIAEAARLLGLSEIELTERIAARCGHRVLPSLEGLIAVVPQGIERHELLCRGAFCFGNGGVVVGVCCIDPALISSLCTLLPGVSIYMSPWGQIRQALEKRDDLPLPAVVKFSRPNQVDSSFRAKALAAIEQVIEEAESFFAYNCAFYEEAGGLHYSFKTDDDRTASGQVAARIAESVRHVLLGVSRGKSLFSRKDNSPIIIEGVECGLTVFRVSFRWMKPLPSSVEPSAVTCSAEQKTATANIPDELPQEPTKIVPKLPVPACAETAAQTSSVKHDNEMSAQGDIRKQSALIIDDNDTFSKVLERFLVRYDLNILRVASAEAGLAMLGELAGNALLVICDVHMPGMSGGDFVKKARALPSFSATPIIMLTSDSDIDTELALLESGADVFINKNEDPRILGAHVQRFVARARKAA
jgi:two-component system chemotaxis response regulator CheY